MTISGAAASPNMGYHSSPFVTLLLALFNVRLGCWLGNPGLAGQQTYRDEMVLRRCHIIVESDATQDGRYTFSDLGNALRKIRIDSVFPLSSSGESM